MLTWWGVDDVRCDILLCISWRHANSAEADVRGPLALALQALGGQQVQPG